LSQTAQKKGLNINAVVMDIANFDFRESSYDIIVAATILDHLPQDNLAETASKIRKALKSNGILYVNVFTVSDPGYERRQHKNSSPSNDVSDTAVCMEHYFQTGELKTLFKDLDILYDYEGVEPDLTHGAPHHHGWACLLARKPDPQKH
jgi:cyclopropane fatty-acyl-phospholipid synthase-like methyltransferase